MFTPTPIFVATGLRAARARRRERDAQVRAGGEVTREVQVDRAVDYYQTTMRYTFTNAKPEAVEVELTQGGLDYGWQWWLHRGRARMSREEMLAHVATHGGYHRGAVGRILSQLSLTDSHTSRVIPARTMRALVRAISHMARTLPGLSRSRRMKLMTLCPA